MVAVGNGLYVLRGLEAHIVAAQVAAVHIELFAVHHSERPFLQYLVTLLVASLEIDAVVVALQLTDLLGAALSELANRFPVTSHVIGVAHTILCNISLCYQ